MQSLPVRNSYQVFLLIFVVCILIAFSSDLRVGLNMSLDARPDFQFFEFVLLLSGIFLLHFSSLISREIDVSGDNWDMLMAVFVLNAVILALFATDTLHSLSRAKDFFFALVLYIVMRYGGFTPKDLLWLIKASILLALFWSFIGLCQWAGLDEEFGGDLYRLFLAESALTKQGLEFFEREVPRSPFAHGLYLYPNNFIYYLVMPFFLSLGLTRISNWWLVASLIIGLAMMATLSKTFMLLLIVFAGIWILDHFLRNRALAGLVFFSCITLLIFWIIYFGDPLYWRVLGGNLVWRFEIWVDTLRMLVQKPSVLLAGDGTYHLWATFARAQYPNPHNLLLYLIIEYGIIGASVMLGFFIARLRIISVSLVKGGPLLSSGFYGMLFFLWMGLVDDILVQTQLTAMIFFYLGMLSRLAQTVSEEGIRA